MNHGGLRPNAGRKIENLKLTMNEALLIIDALNGVIIEPSLAEHLLALEIADAIRTDHLDQKWGVDAEPLVARLSKIDHESAADILERVAAFWQGDETQVKEVDYHEDSDPLSYKAEMEDRLVRDEGGYE